jgi:hypothetical protein
MIAVNALRQQLADLKRQVESCESAIAAIEGSCEPHRWTETEYEPIFHRDYEIPGDPPLKVLARTEKRWKRTCTVCGKEQIFGDPRSASVFLHRPNRD